MTNAEGKECADTYDGKDDVEIDVWDIDDVDKNEDDRLSDASEHTMIKRDELKSLTIWQKLYNPFVWKPFCFAVILLHIIFLYWKSECEVFYFLLDDMINKNDKNRKYDHFNVDFCEI